MYLIRREADVDESMAVKMLMLSALETNLARIGLIVLVLLLVCHHDSGIKVAARERVEVWCTDTAELLAV